jgi:hypothetical protein
MPAKKLIEVVAVRDLLSVLSKYDEKSPLEVDGDTRYDLLVGSLRRARKATKDYDETREGIVKQYGVANAEGKIEVPKKLTVDGVEVDNPKYAEALAALTKIDEREIEFTIQTFPEKVLRKCKNVPMRLIDELITVGVLTEAPDVAA